MKKFTLFFLALFGVFAGYASVYDDASEVTGSFTITPESSYSHHYYKYTPTETTVLSVTFYGSLYLHTDTAGITSSNSSYLTYARTSNYNTNQYTYETILEANTEYFFDAYAWNADEFTVTLSTDTYDQLGTGLSEDDPISIELGESYLVGTPTAKYAYSSSTNTGYATYTAEASNTLKITAFSNATLTINEEDQTYESTKVDGVYQYTYYYSVEEGEEYTLTFTGQYMTAFTADTMTVVEGSSLLPFSISEGENTVPAAAGEYWYAFTPGSSGYGYWTITSEGTVAESTTLQVFQSKSYYKWYLSYGDYYVEASSTGEYNVRFEIDSYSIDQEWIIVITKDEDSETDETFILANNGYEAGDNESSPIELTGPWPMTVTLPYASGETFYSVTLPTDSTYIEVGTTTVPTSEYYTNVYVYNPNASMYDTDGSAFGYRSTSLVGDSLTTYIIDWNYDEEEPISFVINIRPVGQGDEESNPLVAQLGVNTISGIGTRYYQYSATKGGKMTATVPAGVEAYVYNDGSYVETTLAGTTYTFEALDSTNYILQLNYAYEGDTLSLDLGDYEEGESMGTAIDATESGSYNVPDSETGYGALWVKYTVKSTGFLTMAVDSLTYSSTHTVKYYDEDGNGSSMYSGSYSTGYKYSKTIEALEGETYYVYVSASTTFSNVIVTFTESEAKTGETAADPIVLELNKDNYIGMIPASSASGYVMCKITLAADTTTFYCGEEGYIYGYLYQGYPTGTYDYDLYLQVRAEDTTGYRAEVAGDYYIRINSIYYFDDETIFLNVSQPTASSDTETGISAIAAEGLKSKENVYNVSGVLVRKAGESLEGLAKGVYVIGNKKVVIK